MTDEPDNVFPIKPKRQTCGTRRGNGASMHGPGGNPGWGGPPRGNSAIRGRDALIPGQPQDKRERSAEKASRSEALAEEMQGIKLGIARDEKQPANVRLAAAASVEDRLLGRAAQAIMTAQVDPDQLTETPLTFKAVFPTRA